VQELAQSQQLHLEQRQFYLLVQLLLLLLLDNTNQQLVLKLA
jgi:hypothetical protein